MAFTSEKSRVAFVVGWGKLLGQDSMLVHRMSECSAQALPGPSGIYLPTHLKSHCSMGMPQFTDTCALMALSFGVSSVFRDSPTAGRCSAGSSEASQEKDPTAHPAGDPSAGDSGTQKALELHICDFGDSLQLFIILCNPRALTNRWRINICRWRVDINHWIIDR